jgi:hypothetical protein
LYHVLVCPNANNLTRASCITASNTIQLSVHPLPTVKIQSNGPIRAAITLNLTSTVNGGVTGHYTYSWTGANGFTSSSANPSIANATVAASGNYQLTLTDNYGCSNTAQVNATVNPLPVVNSITGNNGACAGTTEQLSNSAPGGVWSSSNTGVATIDKTGKVTAMAAGNTTISYTVTN